MYIYIYKVIFNISISHQATKLVLISYYVKNQKKNY